MSYKSKHGEFILVDLIYNEKGKISWKEMYPIHENESKEDYKKRLSNFKCMGYGRLHSDRIAATNKSDAAKAAKKKWKEEHKEELKKQGKEYYEENKKEIIKKSFERYDKDHKAYYLKRRKYIKKRKERDPLYRMSISWRNLLSSTLYRMGTHKHGKTRDLLQYSCEDLMKHLESLFTEGMTWDNYGKWHIDHIKPVSAFLIDTPPHIVCALENLQPLWAKDNYAKKDKYETILEKEL